MEVFPGSSPFKEPLPLPKQLHSAGLVMSPSLLDEGEDDGFHLSVNYNESGYPMEQLSCKVAKHWGPGSSKFVDVAQDVPFVSLPESLDHRL